LPFLIDFIEVTYGETSLFLEMPISVMSYLLDSLKYLQQRLCCSCLVAINSVFSLENQGFYANGANKVAVVNRNK
jgi:hypothetical protein